VSEPAAETPVWERLDELEEYDELCRSRLDHLVGVREPLVLVSQIQRAGGSLLGQLLDGHRECHAHPHELKIGYPREHNWPPLELARPGTWFDMLFEKRSLKLFVGGYHKSAKKRHPYDAFPFVFLSRLQKQIFEVRVAERRPVTEREVLDAYFTSYFNAWLDNHNLYSGPKRVVTGFAPRLAMEEGNVARFFAAYPDGTLVSIVREPRAWYRSASTYAPEHYADVETAVALWRRSTEAALGASERYGDRVVVLTYEHLLAEPEATMRRLAGWIGIAWSDTLLEPTFNGRPIRANSSDAVAGYGILAERATAGRASLDPAVAAQVDELASDLYEQAVAVAGP
jgi:hypothetical protein